MLCYPLSIALSVNVQNTLDKNVDFFFFFHKILFALLLMLIDCKKNSIWLAEILKQNQLSFKINALFIEKLVLHPKDEGCFLGARPLFSALTCGQYQKRPI